jgi:hypothetical protein
VTLELGLVGRFILGERRLRHSGMGFSVAGGARGCFRLAAGLDGGLCVELVGGGALLDLRRLWLYQCGGIGSGLGRVLLEEVVGLKEIRLGVEALELWKVGEDVGSGCGGGRVGCRGRVELACIEVGIGVVVGAGASRRGEVGTVCISAGGSRSVLGLDGVEAMVKGVRRRCRGGHGAADSTSLASSRLQCR